MRLSRAVISDLRTEISFLSTVISSLSLEMSAAEIAAELTVEKVPDNARGVPDLDSVEAREPERFVVKVGFANAELGDLGACGNEACGALVGSGLSVEGSLDAPGLERGVVDLLVICPMARGAAGIDAALA